MPPADKDVFLTANNLPTAKPTRGGPKTHGVYQTMTPEELAHGHVEEEQQKQEGTAVVAQGHGVGLHPAPALKEDEPTLPPVGNAESKNNVGTSSSSATPRPGAEPLGSQQQQAPTSPATPPPLQRPLVDPASNLIKSRYVLIGAGTASYSALTAIREREPHAEVLVITGERDVPYMRPPLSKELWQSEDDEGVVETLKFKDWVGEDQE